MARLRDVLREGGLAIGRAAVQAGGGFWGAYRAIRDAGLDLTPGQLRRAASAALASARRFVGLMAPERLGLIPLYISDATLDPLAISPYRYIVEVSWTDPGSGESRNIRIGVNSIPRLTATELRSIAIDRARATPGSDEFSGPPDRAFATSNLPDSEFGVSLLHFLTVDRPDIWGT